MLWFGSALTGNNTPVGVSGTAIVGNVYTETINDGIGIIDSVIRRVNYIKTQNDNIGIIDTLDYRVYGNQQCYIEIIIG